MLPLEIVRMILSMHFIPMNAYNEVAKYNMCVNQLQGRTHQSLFVYVLQATSWKYKPLVLWKQIILLL